MSILRPDVPVEAIIELRPGMRPLARGLRRLLWPDTKLSPSTDPGLPPSAPVLVAGDWGSGKSSLLRGIYNEINEKPEKAGQAAAVVWFEAWHYEHSGPLLGALIHAIVASASPSYRRSLVTQRRVKKVMGWVGAVAGRALLGVATGGWLGPKANDGSDFTGTFEGVGVSAVAQDVQTVVGTGESLAMDPVVMLRDSVRGLLKDIWGDRVPCPVVFIDDLDRCSPTAMVELIDALRLLVSDAEGLRCRFVVALDRDIAIEALAHKFGGVARFDGNRYLEKVFPLCLHVPNPSREDVRRMVLDFTGHHREPLASRDKATAPSRLIDDDDVDALSEALRQPVFANPRLIKRCVDRLAVLRQLERWNGSGTSPTEDSEARRDGLELDRALVQWLAASERWPLLRRIARSHGDDFWQHLTRYLTDESGRALIDPELRKLVDEPTFLEWLKREGARRVGDFKNADARLSRMGL